MRTLGIIKRLDDLGRIAIPKELQKMCKLEENDPIEIFIDEDYNIILKKYNPGKDK